MSIKNIALAASMIAFGAFAVSAQAADVAAPAASAAAARRETRTQGEGREEGS